jgi:hypothetical protein
LEGVKVERWEEEKESPDVASPLAAPLVARRKRRKPDAEMGRVRLN